MISNNYYPVSFKNFEEIRKPSGFIIMYCILDDRVHFELTVENAVFATQKFKEDIYKEMEAKGANYAGDQISIFIRSTVQSSSAYRYFPTEEQKDELRKIKLYDRLVVEETFDYPNPEKDEFDLQDTIEESDNFVKTYNAKTLVMKARKER